MYFVGVFLISFKFKKVFFLFVSFFFSFFYFFLFSFFCSFSPSSPSSSLSLPNVFFFFLHRENHNEEREKDGLLFSQSHLMWLNTPPPRWKKKHNKSRRKLIINQPSLSQPLSFPTTTTAMERFNSD